MHFVSIKTNSMLVLLSRGAFKMPKAYTCIYICTVVAVDEKQSDTDIEGTWFHTMVWQRNIFSPAHTNNRDDMTNINYYIHVDLLIP